MNTEQETKDIPSKINKTTKKYKLDPIDTTNYYGRKFYRIIALVDIGTHVKAGDKGGFVECEENLSHLGTSWVYGNAMVYDKAKVFGDAKVYGYAKVYDYAKVYGDAEVFDSACVRGNASVYGNAEVYGSACVYGKAYVFMDAKVSGNARVCGEALVYDKAQIFGNARVCDTAHVFREALVYGNAWVSGNVQISRYARVAGHKDYFCAQSFGSVGRTTTFFRTKNGWAVNCGCFFGTIEEFRKKVKEKHGNSLDAQEYLMVADLMELRIKRVEQELKK